LKKILVVATRAFSMFVVLTILTSALLSMVALGVYLHITPDLPLTEDLGSSEKSIPLRIYSKEGKLIGEFGDKRRSPLEYKQVPQQMINAFISAEDERFFEHFGVDYVGMSRALVSYIKNRGKKKQGGSTITMQLARNLFLTSEKTIRRKLLEIVLAVRIERELSKKQIMKFYLNKIYLGKQAYGVQAAANIYYGKNVDKLSIAQTAMIAGLPKAPSNYNPIANPKRALFRRDYVLGRMYDLDYIKEEVYKKAINEKITAKIHKAVTESEAPYIAEMARQYMRRQFGNMAYRNGYKVYTTISLKLQDTGNKSLRNALLQYDRRHGYRGPEMHKNMPVNASNAYRDKELSSLSVIGGLLPGIITTVQQKSVTVYLKGGTSIELDWAAMKWARKFISTKRTGRFPRTASQILKVGDIIRVHEENGKWILAQIPTVSGALVSIRPKDGAILAMVGGFDFRKSKFNRVTQAKRQPGSNFKPFIYSAALKKGFSPASIFPDTQIAYEQDGNRGLWSPRNPDGKYLGPMRLREALARSRNLVAVRVLQEIGIGYGIDHAANFGFAKTQLPHALSLSLGSAEVTPLQLVAGYAVFANGGFRVEPYYITRIDEYGKGNIYVAEPWIACQKKCGKDIKGYPARRAITAANAFLMTSMMKDVITRGTARKALVLKRSDLAGKTGTTNDQKDAWFSGFNPDLATTVWVGFDAAKNLGRGEYGGKAALPMWINFMRVALKGKPVRRLKPPKNLIRVRIDASTGLLARGSSGKVVTEYFVKGRQPKVASFENAGAPGSPNAPGPGAPGAPGTPYTSGPGSPGAGGAPSPFPGAPVESRRTPNHVTRQGSTPERFDSRQHPSSSGRQGSSRRALPPVRQIPPPGSPEGVF